jgi:hypothetical protein
LDEQYNEGQAIVRELEGQAIVRELEHLRKGVRHVLLLIIAVSFALAALVLRLLAHA